MQKSYLNKLICICMALMFAIAVIGSSNGIESSSRKLPVSARQNAFCERNADDGTAQGLRPVSMCEDMDICRDGSPARKAGRAFFLFGARQPLFRH